MVDKCKKIVLDYIAGHSIEVNTDLVVVKKHYELNKIYCIMGAKFCPTEEGEEFASYLFVVEYDKISKTSSIEEYDYKAPTA